MPGIHHPDGELENKELPCQRNTHFRRNALLADVRHDQRGDLAGRNDLPFFPCIKSIPQSTSNFA